MARVKIDDTDDTEKITFRVTGKVKKKLNEIAKEEDRDRSSLLRYIINMFLKKRSAEESL